jgi:hypothetical protein
VDPRAHDQNVEGARALGFHRTVHFEGAEKIFSVKPAPHGHYGRLDLLQVGADVALLPPVVTSLSLHQLIPEGDLVLQIFFVGVPQGAQPVEKFVTVLNASIDGFPGGDRGRLREGPSRPGKPAKGMSQEESAVVVPVVGGEPV